MSSAIERALAALEVSASLTSHGSVPRDTYAHDVDGLDGRVQQGCDHGERHLPRNVPVVLVFSDFSLVLDLFLPRAMKHEREGLVLPYRLAFGSLNFVVATGTDMDIEGFVLADVGDPDTARPFPVVLPVDIVALGLNSVGSFTDRIRVLTELVGLYSDAVRLCGDEVGIRGELVRSLGLLECFLRVAVGVSGIDDSYAAGDGTDTAGDNPNNVHTSSSHTDDDSLVGVVS